MPQLLSPQVYVQEIDQTVFLPQSLGPAGGIVLRNTYKGREGEAILVTSEVDLITRFGRPTYSADNYRDMFSAIAFLQESNNLYCVRAMPASATFAGTVATSGTSATFTPFGFATAPKLSSGVGDVADPDYLPDSITTNSPNIMTIIAKDRGNSGNFMRVCVCDKTNHDIIRAKTSHLAWTTFNAIYQVDSPLETLRNFLIIVQECKQGADASVESNWSTVEWFNVSTDPLETSDVGEVMYVESQVNTNSNYIRVSFNDALNNQDIGTFATSTWQRLSGGRNNNTATTLADAGTDITVADALLITAQDLFSNAEQIDFDVLIDSDKPSLVKTAMINICNTRKDCMAIVDCLYTHVVNQVGQEEENLRSWVLAWRSSENTVNSSYAAVYGNWLDVYDKYNSVYRWVPSSGYAAAVYARCQNEEEYWSTPAGFNRGQISGVRRLAWNPSQSQRDGIYKHGINPVVSFSGQGKLLYGSKTMLDKSSAFNRINVRRLFISLESDVSTLARKYLFEPNNAFHRAALVNEVKPIFDYAATHDGLQKYKIICDETNNTPERVQQNQLWMDIYVMPTYISDFIIITFIATKSSTDFTESAVNVG